MLTKYIPNILTSLNLSLGILSILSTYNKNYFLAAIMIIVAAIVDRYDGRIARFFEVSSDIGKELDSLSDLISFGVAPAILIGIKFNFLNSGLFGQVGVVALVLYVICAAFRLANYNVKEFDGYFTGVPITIAGSIISVFTLISLNFNIQNLLSIVMLISFAYLMLSKLKLKKI